MEMRDVLQILHFSISITLNLTQVVAGSHFLRTQCGPGPVPAILVATGSLGLINNVMVIWEKYQQRASAPLDLDQYATPWLMGAGGSGRTGSLFRLCVPLAVFGTDFGLSIAGMCYALQALGTPPLGTRCLYLAARTGAALFGINLAGYAFEFAIFLIVICVGWAR